MANRQLFDIGLRFINLLKYYFGKNFQVLLVTSSRRPDNWIVPGGGVEPNEEPACTAVREVLEEAGVIGALGRCLGMFEVSVERTHAHTHTNHS